MRRNALNCRVKLWRRRHRPARSKPRRDAGAGLAPVDGWHDGQIDHAHSMHCPLSITWTSAAERSRHYTTTKLVPLRRPAAPVLPLCLMADHGPADVVRAHCGKFDPRSIGSARANAQQRRTTALPPWWFSANERSFSELEWITGTPAKMETSEAAFTRMPYNGAYAARLSATPTNERQFPDGNQW